MHPIEQLKLEHQNILRGVKYLQRTGEISKQEKIPMMEVNLLLQFFRGYADAGHHAKEEEILFTRLIEKEPGIDDETSPLGMLIQQHKEGRNLVGSLSEMNDKYSLYVDSYSDLLNRHIDIEDNLFPSLVEDYLTEAEVKMMSIQFYQVDAVRDINKYLKILEKLEIMI